MVLYEKYYEVSDLSTDYVNKAWKAAHILLYVVAVIFGFISSYNFGTILLEFGENCVLYPNISFINKTIGNNTLILDKDANITFENVPQITFKIDTSQTLWGNYRTCDFCQFSPVLSMILGTIFISFFAMWPRGGTNFTQTGIKRPWHLVFPSLLITGMFLIVIAVSSTMLSSGLNAFCKEFAPVLNNSDCLGPIDQFRMTDNETNIHKHISMAKYSLVVCMIAWFFSFALLLLRCCCLSDFKIIQVNITSVDHDFTEEAGDFETESLIANSTAPEPSEPISYV